MASRVLIPHFRFSNPISPYRSFARTSPLRRYATQGVRQPTRTGTFYKSFGSPILKCFLGALFTYQLAYWAWMKLESLEQESDYQDEMHDLQEELKDLLRKKASAERQLKEAQAGMRQVGNVDEAQKPGRKTWLW